MQMMLKGRVNGFLSLSTGIADITDPCYKQDCWCAMTHVSVKKGDYVSMTYYADDFCGWGRRTAILQIVHRDYFNKFDTSDNAPWEELGNVGVDTGLMSISESPKPDYDDVQWQEFCRTIEGHELGTIREILGKQILVSSTGIGDGYYPVYCLRNPEGEIVAVEVRFAEDSFPEESDESVVS